MRAAHAIWLCAVAVIGIGMASRAADEWNAERILKLAPFGPHRGGSMSSFANADRIVGAYYFYWYRHDTKEHFVDGDGSDALVDHFVKPETVSYASAAWHRKELEDVMDAGIDVISPVWWGNPADRQPGGELHWSFEGVPALVKAMEELTAAGKKPPKIALFYDTSTLRHNRDGFHADLTTEAGRAWFYVTVRDFYSLVPPKFRAAIDGKPIILLYAAAFAKNYDAGLVEYLKSKFKSDFGVEPFIGAEVSWSLPADDKLVWGAALSGLLMPGGIATIGPGYDDSAVPGRTTPKRLREGGRFYSAQWERLLRANPARRPKWVWIETWNEMHEGTDICESRKYGRQYIHLTAQSAKRFREGERLKSSLSSARQVSVMFGMGDAERGLRLHIHEDGPTRTVEVGGSTVVESVPNRFSDWRYLYFDVSDDFFYDDEGALDVEIDYWDEGTDRFALQYDSMKDAYVDAGHAALGGLNAWKTAKFRLKEPRLTGRENGGDFRLAHRGGTLRVREVRVIRAGGVNR